MRFCALLGLFEKLIDLHPPHLMETSYKFFLNSNANLDCRSFSSKWYSLLSPLSMKNPPHSDRTAWTDTIDAENTMNLFCMSSTVMVCLSTPGGIDSIVLRRYLRPQLLTRVQATKSNNNTIASSQLLRFGRYSGRRSWNICRFLRYYHQVRSKPFQHYLLTFHRVTRPSAVWRVTINSLKVSKYKIDPETHLCDCDE